MYVYPPEIRLRVGRVDLDAMFWRIERRPRCFV